MYSSNIMNMASLLINSLKYFWCFLNNCIFILFVKMYILITTRTVNPCNKKLNKPNLFCYNVTKLSTFSQSIIIC